MIILVPKREKEDIDTLDEMSTLRKNRSGLPVNLWLDDSMLYKRGGHAKRIKFQPDKGDRPTTRNMIPMSIEDDPKVMINAKTSLSSTEINKIKLFVKMNKDALIDLSDMKIDFIDFVGKMIKV